MLGLIVLGLIGVIALIIIGFLLVLIFPLFFVVVPVVGVFILIVSGIRWLAGVIWFIIIGVVSLLKTMIPISF